MNAPAQFSDGDPFVQVVFRSVALTMAMTFAVTLSLEFTWPELRTSLFVPIAVGFFMGTTGFQVERAGKRQAPAILWLGTAILLFPLASWLLLTAAHIPYEATAAKFVALAPQALAAPPLFEFAKKRFRDDSRAR